MTGQGSNMEKEFAVLSIDAWRQPDGWTWNNWHRIGKVDGATVDSWGYPVKARRVLAWARREGYLTSRSIGRCAIDDDGYNVIIVDRSTGEPLLAVEIGSA